MNERIETPGDDQVTIARLRIQLASANSLAEHQADRIRSLVEASERQGRIIGLLDSTLRWLQREHPLPIGQGEGDPYGLMRAASDAARGLG